ncbi:hypothetical protein Hanom_Chr11g01051451 [Helianthus anomalus]
MLIAFLLRDVPLSSNHFTPQKDVQVTFYSSIGLFKHFLQDVSYCKEMPSMKSY